MFYPCRIITSYCHDLDDIFRGIPTSAIRSFLANFYLLLRCSVSVVVPVLPFSKGNVDDEFAQRKVNVIKRLSLQSNKNFLGRDLQGGFTLTC